MAGEEGEGQSLTTGKNEAGDTITVWLPGAGTGHGVREDAVGMTSHEG